MLCYICNKQLTIDEKVIERFKFLDIAKNEKFQINMPFCIACLKKG